MYDCEVCGRKANELYIVDVEGVELPVCKRCANGKNVIDIIGNEEKAPSGGAAPRPKEEEEELIDGYGKEIRKARERLGIPLKVLGELISEKESTLLRVEQERMQPSIKLTRRIEKELGIKLTAKPVPSPDMHGVGGKRDITLGDAAFKKER